MPAQAGIHDTWQMKLPIVALISACAEMTGENGSTRVSPSAHSCYAAAMMEGASATGRAVRGASEMIAADAVRPVDARAASHT